MRFAYVLEKDPKFQKEICEVLLKIEADLQVRVFDSLETFVDWVKKMMNDGPKALATGGLIPEGFTLATASESDDHELALVIAPVEFFGTSQIGLIKKTKDYFIKRKLCTPEDPTAFILTAFDDSQVDTVKFRDGIINNIVFKPFDKLILTQHLTFGLDGRHPPSSYAIANQKFSVAIEMLKSIPAEGLSEVGFLTKSDRPLQPGTIAKYYGTPFIAERQKSMMAKVVESIPHPENPSEFMTALQFFAADPTQISQIRRRITNEAELHSYQWVKSSSNLSSTPSSTASTNGGTGLPGSGSVSSPSDQSSSPSVQGSANADSFQVLFIDTDKAQSESLADGLKRKFQNVQATQYDDLSDLLVELDPKAGGGGDASVKAFTPSQETELQFDIAGRVLFKSSATELFGHKAEDTINKTNWWVSLLEPDKVPLWRQWIQNPTTETRWKIKGKSNVFFVKSTQATKADKILTIKFVELTTQEKMDFISSQSKVPRRVDAIFIGHQYFTGTTPEKWKQLREMILNRNQQSKLPAIFMVAARTFSDTEERELAQSVDDIFFKPVDRSYFLKKIKFNFPYLVPTEGVISFPTLIWSEKFKTANPVKISEISEAGLILAYPRALAVGEFREFLLWRPYEIEAPELWAQSNFVEENQAVKGEFNCHFVFFAVSDKVLKQIRLWLRDSYISSKEAQ